MNEPQISNNQINGGIKKNNTFLYILLVLVIGINVFLGYELLKKNDKEKQNKDNESDKIEEKNDGFVYDENNTLVEVDINSTYSYVLSNGDPYKKLKNGDHVTFYNSSLQKMSEFVCNNIECYIDIPNNTSGVPKSKYVLISLCETGKCTNISTYGGVTFRNGETYVNGTVLIYNIETGESKRIDNVTNFHHFSRNFAYMTLNDNEHYIISYDGLVNRKIEEPSLYCWEGCGLASASYNYKDNLIVTIKNGKYGIEQLSTGNVIVPHTYDKIQLTDNSFPYSYYKKGYFVGEKDGKQNLYRIKTNKAVLKNVYDRIFFLSENTFLVYNDKYFSIKNMNEEDIVNDKIYVEKLIEGGPQNPNGIYVTETSIENVIELVFTDSNNSYMRYHYNLITNEFIKTN